MQLVTRVQRLGPTQSRSIPITPCLPSDRYPGPGSTPPATREAPQSNAHALPAPGAAVSMARFTETADPCLPLSLPAEIRRRTLRSLMPFYVALCTCTYLKCIPCLILPAHRLSIPSWPAPVNTVHDSFLPFSSALHRTTPDPAPIPFPPSAPLADTCVRVTSQVDALHRRVALLHRHERHKLPQLDLRHTASAAGAPTQSAHAVDHSRAAVAPPPEVPPPSSAHPPPPTAPAPPGQS